MDKNKLLNDLNIYYISYKFENELVLKDVDFKIENLVGFNKKKLLNNNFWMDIIKSVDEKSINNKFKDIIKLKKEKYIIRYYLNTKNKNRLIIKEKGKIDYGKKININAFIEIDDYETDNFKKTKKKIDQLEAILDHIPGLVFYKDKQNNFLKVNKYVADAHGLSKEKLVGTNLDDLYDKEISEKYFNDDLAVIEKDKPKLNIVESWEVDGETHWVNTSKIPFHNSKGEVIGVIGIAFDITEIVDLRKRLQIFEKIITESPNAILITNNNAKIEYVNDAFESISGYSKKELIGKDPNILQYNKDANVDYDLLWKKLKNGQKWEGIFQNKRKNGEIYWERALIFPIKIKNKYKDKKEIKLIGIKKDITKEYKQKLEIKRLSVIDQLTQVYNRRGFMRKVKYEFNRFKRYKNQDFFIMLDIDKFKLINDQYGHDIGDLALKRFAQTCKKQIRKTDIIGRMGGDEFAVCLIETSRKNAKKVVKRIKEKVNSIEIIIDNDNLVKFHTSIGITPFKLKDKDINDVYKRADKALYISKNQGESLISWN